MSLIRRCTMPLIVLATATVAHAQTVVEYAGYEVSIKQGERGKRSGDISSFYYALPDHDMLSLKINLEPRAGATPQSWQGTRLHEPSKMWVVNPARDEFVLETSDGQVYHSLHYNPSDEAGRRQIINPVEFFLKDNGKQALLWPNWLWFDVPRDVATEALTLRVGDARLPLDNVEAVERECTSSRLKGGTCDYPLPADKPSAMVSFVPVKGELLGKDHRANYSVYPSSCHTPQRRRIGYFLGQARRDQFAISRYQARIQAGEPIILSARMIDPGFSITNEDDRTCDFILELTLNPGAEYEIRSEIFHNRCGLAVLRADDSGWRSVEAKEIPARFGGKPNCKKYLKSLEE